jgi:DNA invertase Pin-like site-specific DNA recombinase
MTRDDIIAMAEKAGLQPYYDAQQGAIEQFAAIVAAAERERIATSRPEGCRAAIARAREEERKACAEHYLGIMREAIKEEREACRSIVMEAFDDTWSGTKENDILYEIAAAIRARSTTCGSDS